MRIERAVASLETQVPRSAQEGGFGFQDDGSVFRIAELYYECRVQRKLMRHDEDVSGLPSHLAAPLSKPDFRLRKHADYQRVYREGRKNFSASMSYFYAPRGAESAVPPGARVGLTAGKVLGKAVERNRIKRRMRDIVRRRAASVSAEVDIVLHPRRSVLTTEFAKLDSEVARIFAIIQSAIETRLPDKSLADKAKPGRPSAGRAKPAGLPAGRPGLGKPAPKPSPKEAKAAP